MTTSKSPYSVRKSIEAHLKTQSANTGIEQHKLRRQFTLSRFLARVFATDPDGWILKGGTGMMVRLPNARHSKDIDLLATRTSDAIASLRAVGQDDFDHFRFDIISERQLAEDRGTTLSVAARLGTQVFDKFSIDIVEHERVLVGEIEGHPLPLLLNTEDFREDVTIRLYPLADQIADKLCAMYEVRTDNRGRTRESGRYRDLVDLLLISQNLSIDLAATVEATNAERLRRNIEQLPAALVSPGDTWRANWSRYAADGPLDADLRELDTALAEAGTCYDRILSNLPRTTDIRIWSCREQTWSPPSGLNR